MGDDYRANNPTPPLTEEQCRVLKRGIDWITLTDEQRKWIDSNNPYGDWNWEGAHQLWGQLYSRLTGRPDRRDLVKELVAAEVKFREFELTHPDARKWFESHPLVQEAQHARRLIDTKELAAELGKALRQPRRKRALNPEAKTARARRLAEELHPNGVGAVGEKNQKAIRSKFCDAYRERYGEGLSDSQASKALFGQRD
jgi:hypothetical protein